MTDVALSILALIAGGLTLELFTVATPLPGYQEQGFPLVTEGADAFEEVQAGNPS